MARFENLTHLVRQSLFHLSKPGMRLVACICDVLGGRKLEFVMSFTWCLCPFLTVTPSVRHASLRASRWSWRHARRRGSRAAGARCCLCDAHAMFIFSYLPRPSVCLVLSKWYFRQRMHDICERVRTRFASTLFLSFLCCRSQ